jgi:hypothetical protein
MFSRHNLVYYHRKTRRDVEHAKFYTVQISLIIRIYLTICNLNKPARKKQGEEFHLKKSTICNAMILFRMYMIHHLDYV